MTDRRVDSENDAAATGADDPGVIRSVAVTVEDVVTALEANRSADRGAVLRITPPFSGRMRARIHVADAGADYTGDGTPIHLDPASLVADLPAYPTADETALEETDVDTRHHRHTERVEQWRETVSRRLRDEVTVATDSGRVEMQVVALGDGY